MVKAITYKPHLVTFIDILGFGDLVKNTEADGIKTILGKLLKHTTEKKEDRKIFEIQTIAFSDSIVRAVHVLSSSNLKHPVGILYYELLQLAFLQSILIFEDDVFLRGGITTEELFIKDGVVFGPGLIQAYELETALS